jgi:hypothetical protein
MAFDKTLEQLAQAQQRVWQVTRTCCTSGQCVLCHSTGMRRRRIIHADKLTEQMAKTVEKNWSAYDAKASRM